MNKQRDLKEKKALILQLLHRRPRLPAIKIRMQCLLGNECQELLDEMASDGLLTFLPSSEHPQSKGVYVITTKGLVYLRGEK